MNGFTHILLPRLLARAVLLVLLMVTQSTGNCNIDGCGKSEHGNWGPRCENRCLDCRSCDCEKETGRCTQCVQGRYTEDCSKDCPVNCRSGNDYNRPVDCNRTTGECSDGCVGGWWGLTCDKQCGQGCRQNTCVQKDGRCMLDCIEGWEGYKCDIHSGASTAGDENSLLMDAMTLMFILFTAVFIIKVENSPVCKDGYYGYECAYKCGENCLNKKCQLTGSGTFTCTDGCVDGYRGDSCRSRCPPYCMKCQRYTTDHCLQCSDFHFGLSCEDSCREECPTTGCDTDGKCLSDKKYTCGTRCKECNRISQICSECETGFYGEKCDLPCSAKCGCVDQQQNSDQQQDCTGLCEMNTGNCTSGCVKSYFGNKCQHRCSDHCVKDECNASSGVCLKGCKTGYFGEKCESGCNDHCKDSFCDGVTGKCEHGCADGYYGSDCTVICGEHCAHSICQRESGDCTNGCNEGYYGMKCEKKCDAGCKVCNRHTGECILQHTTEDTGNAYTSAQEIKPATPYLYYIVAGAVGAMLLLLTIGSIVFRFCKGKRNNDIIKPENSETSRASKEIPDHVKSFIDINGYSEIYEKDTERRRNISSRRTRSFSHHQPATEELLPSAPPCYGFKRASTLGSGDGWRRSANICRSPSLRSSRDTDDVVSELKRLTSLEDYIKVCDDAECQCMSVK